MLLMNLFMPIMMIAFGKRFCKKAPDEINYLFGYRTTMSMKNKDTWAFAHNFFGKIWYIMGLVILPLSVTAMLLVLGKSEDTIGRVGSIVCLIQVALLIASIFPTERALKRNFDEDGNRR